jgi:hypothetical protein
LIQQDVLGNTTHDNSLLLITKCDEKDWVKNQLKVKNANPQLKKAIDNCNGKYFEFDLKFPTEEKYAPKCEESRRLVIDGLLSKIQEFFDASDKIEDQIKQLQIRLDEIQRKKNQK